MLLSGYFISTVTPFLRRALSLLSVALAPSLVPLPLQNMFKQKKIITMLKSYVEWRFSDEENRKNEIANEPFFCQSTKIAQ